MPLEPYLSTATPPTIPLKKRSRTPPRLHRFAHSLKNEASWSTLISQVFDIQEIDSFDGPVHCEQRDVSADKAFQARGVDFEYQIGDKTVWLDDKADSHLTKNMALELVSKNRWGQLKPGWLYSSEMAWLRYGFTSNGDVFLVPMTELREFLVPLIATFRPASAVNAMSGSRAVRHITFSALVPITAVLAACPGTLHVDMCAALCWPFSEPSMYPPEFPAHRGNCNPMQAVLAMAEGPGKSEPLAPDYEAMWTRCRKKDLMRWNSWAFKTLDAPAEQESSQEQSA